MLWEMAAGLNNEYRVLVPIGDELECAKYFRVNGKPLQWSMRPEVAPFVEVRRKRQKARADIEYITWGAIVLNQRAYQAMQSILSPFGEFLSLNCQGETLYFYNVTTLHNVVDDAASGKNGEFITRPCFISTAIPHGICIFKDSLTASTAIYLNDETKRVLEKLLAEHGLTGLYFGEAGKLD